jgi:hypothetical protein
VSTTLPLTAAPAALKATNSATKATTHARIADPHSTHENSVYAMAF